MTRPAWIVVSAIDAPLEDARDVSTARVRSRAGVEREWQEARSMGGVVVCVWRIGSGVDASFPQTDPGDARARAIVRSAIKRALDPKGRKRP